MELAGGIGAGDLRQHALFAAFDDFEGAKVELVLRHHVQKQAVAVIARLDPVDLALKRIFLRRDLGVIVDAQIGAGLVGGQRVFRAGQVGAQPSTVPESR